LVFGHTFTDHMLTIEWNAKQGWAKPAIAPHGKLSLNPSSNVFLYGKRFYATIPKENPKLMEANIALNKGLEYWNQDNLQKAKVAFETSIKLVPTSDAYYNLANVYFSLGKSDQSIKNWLKSLELQDGANRVDVYCNLASAYALTRDFEKAIEFYKKALSLDDEDGELHYNYAVVLDNVGKLEEAIGEYQIAVSFGIVQAENTLRNARAKWVVSQKDLEKSGDNN
jgi:tetratricopeptide (TPR) repeat protein